MSWIKTIPYHRATGKLKTIYDKVKGPKNYIDNILMVHSLRPHTLSGHMALYKNVLHHSSNTFSNWLLEALGTYTSYLNQCEYCYLHHFQGMKRFLKNDLKAESIKHAIETDTLEQVLSYKEKLLFDYAKKLTFEAGELTQKDINLLQANFDDGQILELNQVVSYFNYANRTVLGLGVTTKGDTLGLSPKNKKDENDWGHE